MRRLIALAVLALLLPAPSSSATEPVRVYPLGDSITFGTTYRLGVNRAEMPGGYRDGLHQLFAERGVAHQFVGTRTDNSTELQRTAGQDRHDGWPGFTIGEVAGALDGAAPSPHYGRWLTGNGVRPAVHPDVVVLHLGTNDISREATSRNYANPVVRAVFVEELALRLDTLVDKLQALRPGVRIVLSTVIPILEDAAPGDPHLVPPDYAVAVRELVEAEENVVLADAWSRFVADGVPIPGLVSPDAFHPTPAGYAVLSSVFADAVVAALAL